MIIVAGISFALCVIVIVGTLLLRSQLREKYATLWLIVGCGVLVISVFPGLLYWLTRTLGVEVPANLLFAISIALLIGVTLHQSWELSRSEDEVRRVSEEVAILRADVDGLLGARADAPSGESAQAAPDADERPGKIQ